MNTKDQFAAINEKFNELRKEINTIKYPAGARPTASDIWVMATQLAETD